MKGAGTVAQKLTTKEQAGWQATVTRLNVKPPVRTGVGIGGG